MPSWAETQLAIRGLLRLARFDPDFLRYFDQSASGALRSFGLALPLFAYHLWAIWPIADPIPPNLSRYYVAMTVAYFYLWILPALIIAWVSPLFGREDAVPVCISVYNWMSLLVVAVFTPLLILGDVGVDPALLIVPTYGVRMILVAWEAYVLARTLRVPLWAGALFGIGDFFATQWLVLPIFYTLGMAP